MKETVVVNGQEMTKEEFQKLKENLQADKTQQLTEVSSGVYKTRLLG